MSPPHRLGPLKAFKTFLIKKDWFRATTLFFALQLQQQKATIPYFPANKRAVNSLASQSFSKSFLYKIREGGFGIYPVKHYVNH
jgi:hypothetical protein